MLANICNHCRKILLLSTILVCQFVGLANAQSNLNSQIPQNISHNNNSNDMLMNLDFQRLHNNHIPAFNETLGYGLERISDNRHQDLSLLIQEGTYLVRLEINCTSPQSKFTIWSEDRRMMTMPQTISSRQKVNYSFFANTKNPYLNQAEQDHSNSPKVGLRGEELNARNWDDLLTISIAGEGVSFSKISIEKTNVPKILLAGDSTVTDQAGGDYASWGQILPAFIKNYPIVNHARSGETLKSFIFSLRWDKLLSNINRGDIVLIQFGHNDQKSQWPRTFAAYNGAYPEYLRAFVADVRQRGGQAVLVSPVARRRFDANGKIINSHKGYDDAVKMVANDMGVPFIDLTKDTAMFYENLGPIESKLAFGNEGNDGTHHNYYGAYLIASMVARSLGNNFPNIEIEPKISRATGYPSYNEVKLDDTLWPNIQLKPPEQTHEVKPMPKS